MSANRSNIWYLASFPSGVAFGMIGVLIPLYLVEELKGTILDIGIMTSVSTLVLIPASVWLGKLPDKYNRSKPFILASYLIAGLAIQLMSLTRNILIFQILYVLMNLANYLVGPSTSVLIAESFERASWGKAMARRSFMDGAAQALGLGICTLFANSLGYSTLLNAAAPLVFASLVIALVTIQDSPLYVERFLGRIERPVEDLVAFSFHMNRRGGITRSYYNSLRFGGEPRMGLFGIGKVLFAFAASNVLTSFPIYLKLEAKFSSSTIFLIFFIRGLAETLSYPLMSSLVKEGGGFAVKSAAVLRVFLILLLSMIPVLAAPFSVVLAVVLLSLIAASWSLYALGTEVVTVQNANYGSLGTYDALANLGSSSGNLIGCTMSGIVGFGPLFIVSSVVFASAAFSFITSRV